MSRQTRARKLKHKRKARKHKAKEIVEKEER